MASLKIQFSVGDLEQDIKDRAVLDERSASLIAQRDLARYYRMLRASLPRFGYQEARVLVDAIGPHTRAGGTGLPGSADADPAMLWAYVESRKEVYAREQASREEHKAQMQAQGFEPNEEVWQEREAGVLGHGVDMDAFVERLRRLTLGEGMAIIDAVERLRQEYLNEDDEEEPDPPYMANSYQELTRVGLVSNEDQAFEVLAYWYELERPSGAAIVAYHDLKRPGDDMAELNTVYRAYERVSRPMRSEKEATALADTLRAEERKRCGETRARRYFMVADVRDHWHKRESLQVPPRAVAPLIVGETVATDATG